MAEAIDLKYTKNMEFKHQKLPMPVIKADGVHFPENAPLMLFKFFLFPLHLIYINSIAQPTFKYQLVMENNFNVVSILTIIYLNKISSIRKTF